MCGKRLDEPAEQPSMPGLEPTSRAQADADAGAGTMPGLEPTGRESVAEVAVTPLPDLEPTGADSPAVVSERMPGLVTTEEALGDTRIPDEPVPETPRCPRCKVEVAEARFCPRCGYAVVAIHAESVGSAPNVVCTECGVPNPSTRTQCMTCGNRI
jgi:ribosomal protein S27AE